ncbi:hypothetical protein [Methanobrevibacter filiformis]|nr:hypothetical protein [Methanobrevibacter filiformis]
MPDNVRVDNFHGFPHIHFSLKGKHNKININNMDDVPRHSNRTY